MSVPQGPDGEPTRSGPPPLHPNAVRRARSVAEQIESGDCDLDMVAPALVDLLVAYDNLAARMAVLAASVPPPKPTHGALTRDELTEEIARIDYWGARGLGPARSTARRIVDMLAREGLVS